jgi:sucrose-phosphate synthase
MPPLSEIQENLERLDLPANLIYSHNEFLDVLPMRASKGHAIRYLATRWNLPLGRFLVAGDSGNDVEMVVGDTLDVVVGNFSKEVATLRGHHRVYFACRCHAGGVLEGIAHYGFGDTLSGEPKK